MKADQSALAGATGQAIPVAAVRVPSTTSVGTHYLRYTISNVLGLLAGLVSFPILTRLLDNTQYGILGYYETWIALIVAVAKFGSQHSILRFYPHGGDAAQHGHFATNLVLLPIAASLALWALCAAILGAISAVGAGSFSPVFWCALFMIPLVVMSNVMDIVFLASERSLLLTVVRVCKRWLEVGLVLAAVILLERSAVSVYVGKLVAGVLVLVFSFNWLYRNMSFSRSLVDLSAIRAGLIYGLPLVANEVAAVTLGSIDRIMLKHMLGEFSAVGVYTIGYSLAMYVGWFMNSTLQEAFIPVANRLYGSADAAAVRALKDRILLPLTYASFGAAALLWSVGADALVALSGPGKAASGVVFSVVGVSFALFPLVDVSGYGLLLQKRSLVVFAATLGAAALNIALNLVLIPAYGVMGAVWATIISYAALGITNCILCPRALLRFPEWRALALAGSCAVVLLATIKAGNLFGVTNPWLRLFLAGWMFLGLYVVPVWLLDPRLRQAVLGWRRKAAPQGQG